MSGDAPTADEDLLQNQFAQAILQPIANGGLVHNDNKYFVKQLVTFCVKEYQVGTFEDFLELVIADQQILAKDARQRKDDLEKLAEELNREAAGKLYSSSLFEVNSLNKIINLANKAVQAALESKPSAAVSTKHEEFRRSVFDEPDTSNKIDPTKPLSTHFTPAPGVTLLYFGDPESWKPEGPEHFHCGICNETIKLNAPGNAAHIRSHSFCAAHWKAVNAYRCGMYDALHWDAEKQNEVKAFLEDNGNFNRDRNTSEILIEMGISKPKSGCGGQSSSMKRKERENESTATPATVTDTAPTPGVQTQQ